MQRGSATALAAFLVIAISATQAIAADEGPRDPRRLYDRQTECAVFDTRGFEATSANWDGPCTRGLASGRGTATYFGRNGVSEVVSAIFRDGILVDGKAEIRWSDGAHYAGELQDGAPQGQGVLVNAKGDRFEGMWRDGQLNGHGSVAWANGDRYEGDWVDGKAEGHGIQKWADGQTYDGAWHNDQPNGQGTVTRKDGSTFTAMFVDGKRQEIAAAAPQAAAAASPVPVNASTPASSADAATPSAIPALLEGVSGLTLIGVDGSTVRLAAAEGGIVRTLTAPDGRVQASVFKFLGPNLGTVADQADPRRVSGMFRVTSDGVVVEYSDGRAEILHRDPAGAGVLMTTRSAAGISACSSWYPEGHMFSVAERRAAVAAYAQRLGVAETTPAPSSCANQPLAAPTAASHGAAGHRPAPTPQHTNNTAPSSVQPTAKPSASAALQTVPVKDSNVHLIDAPPASAPSAAAGVTPIVPVADERIASNCLKVDSDGSYWGFRNHCGYSVQFAYCLLHGINPMTACGDRSAAGVAGSVSANGFGALFADDSLAERDAEHQFRWVGCKGGAGEVIAQLDHAEPAAGQCVRTKTAQRDN